jgi:uncharacterized protein (DUF608 family)
MDYIQLVDLHSKMNNYTVYHFSAFPFFLGQIEKEVESRIVDIYKKYEISNDYLTTISLDEFTDINGERLVVYHKYALSGDGHPLPMTNYHYVEQIIAPKLKIDLNKDQLPSIIKEQDNIIQFGKLKDET